MQEIAIRTQGRAGRITLRRPAQLNALSEDMLRAISAALDAWREDPDVALVVIDAEGERAFCAGGDIAAVYRMGRAGDAAGVRRFFAEEYRMNARLAAFPKPVVAFMQGMVMGGGVGVAGHLSHRVVGETTRIAMPECAIGLVPDVGSTHLLGRAPGRLGEYLGLTGHRMGPADALLAGFADLFVPLDRWPETKAALIETGAAAEAYAHADEPPAALPDDGVLAARREEIDAAFAAEDLVGIRDHLRSSAWGRGVAATLERQCPLSLGCALALIRAARAEPGVDAALRREYRFSARAVTEGEHLEGIRAAIIDKDRRPRWRDTIQTLPRERVAAMLAPLGPDELDLTGCGGA